MISFAAGDPIWYGVLPRRGYVNYDVDMLPDSQNLMKVRMRVEVADGQLGRNALAMSARPFNPQQQIFATATNSSCIGVGLWEYAPRGGRGVLGLTRWFALEISRCEKDGYLDARSSQSHQTFWITLCDCELLGSERWPESTVTTAYVIETHWPT